MTAEATILGLLAGFALICLLEGWPKLRAWYWRHQLARMERNARIFALLAEATRNVERAKREALELQDIALHLHNPAVREAYQDWTRRRNLGIDEERAR